MRTQFLTPLISKILPYVAIAGCVVIGYWYVTNLQEKVADYQQIISELQIAIDQQKAAIQSINQDRREIYKLINQADQVRVDVSKSIEQLESKFNKVNPTRERRDISKIAAAKPKLLENIINKATNEAFECLEQVTQNGVKTNEIYQKCNIGNSN